MKVKLKGNYDQNKKTFILVEMGGLFSPIITKRAYQSAILRMGLTNGDFPRLDQDFPTIVVKDKYDIDFAYIQ